AGKPGERGAAPAADTEEALVPADRRQAPALRRAEAAAQAAAPSHHCPARRLREVGGAAGASAAEEAGAPGISVRPRKRARQVEPGPAGGGNPAQPAGGEPCQPAGGKPSQPAGGKPSQLAGGKLPSRAGT